jgi:plasmid stability protein
MGTLTIRNLDDNLKQKLRERAARHGVSMEQEARNLLLKDVAAAKERDGDFVTAEEILEFGRRLQQADFDQKKFTDDLWSFIEEE